jgi:hypothetical protein
MRLVLLYLGNEDCLDKIEGLSSFSRFRQFTHGLLRIVVFLVPASSSNRYHKKQAFRFEYSIKYIELLRHQFHFMEIKICNCTLAGRTEFFLWELIFPKTGREGGKCGRGKTEAVPVRKMKSIPITIRYPYIFINYYFCIY